MLQSFLHFLHSLYDPDGLKELIRSGGAPLICGIVFIETGFFVGFFLPGDSLLITRVRTRLEEQFDRRIPIVDLFRHTTVRTLARYLDDGRELVDALSPEVALRATRQREAVARARAHGSRMP